MYSTIVYLIISVTGEYTYTREYNYFEPFKYFLKSSYIENFDENYQLYVKGNKGKYFNGITSVKNCKNPLHWLARGGPRLKQYEVPNIDKCDENNWTKDCLYDADKDTHCETCIRGPGLDETCTPCCGEAVHLATYKGQCTWTCSEATHWYLTHKVPSEDTVDEGPSQQDANEMDIPFDITTDDFVKEKYRNTGLNTDLSTAFGENCTRPVKNYKFFREYLDYSELCPECEIFCNEDKPCADDFEKKRYEICIFDVCMMRKTDRCSDLLTQMAKKEDIIKECTKYNVLIDE